MVCDQTVEPPSVAVVASVLRREPDSLAGVKGSHHGLDLDTRHGAWQRGSDI
jgi:hypothetical protein